MLKNLAIEIKHNELAVLAELGRNQAGDIITNYRSKDHAMNKIFLGIKGHAVCINKKTGKEVWRTKLKVNWGGVTNIHYDNNLIYVYVNGHLFCLDSESGSIKWGNDLPGLGHSYCIIASQHGSQQTAINAAASFEEAQGAASG